MTMPSSQPARSGKPFTLLAVALFCVIAFVHLLRLVLGWKVTFNDAVVPWWVSLLGLVVPAALAYLLWRESRR